MKAATALMVLVLAVVVWETASVVCDCKDGCNDGCLRCKKSDGTVYHKCKQCNTNDKPGYKGDCKSNSSCTKCVFCRKDNPKKEDKRFVACNTCPPNTSFTHGEYPQGACPKKPPGF